MKTLKAFIERALDESADAISIEYKDGYEEVCLLRGNIGLELDKIKSNSDQSKSMFNELAEIEAQGYMLIGNQRITLNVDTYDNFGDAAYRITISNSESHPVQ